MTRAHRHRDTRAVIGWAAATVIVASLATVDGLVAVVIGTSMAAIYGAIRWRSPGRVRKVAIGATATVAVGGMVVALALPVYAQRPAPLIVNVSPQQSTSASSPLGSDRPTFDVLGYVASDYEDSAAGVDRDVSRVSTLAPTGISLGATPGTLEVADATDTLVRAHAEGTRAVAVVSNYDGTDFNGARVEALLRDPHATQVFISGLARLVAQKGWDGVVIDFERLTPAVRRSFPALLRSLDQALGSRSVDVAIPAFTDPNDPDLAAYDLAAIGQAADRVTWMAYDQHELASAPGPIAGVAWLNAGLDLALKKIPSSKLLLGVAAYGYAWSSPGHATEYSSSASIAMSKRPGSTVHWDETTGEWTGKLADHRTIWYEDGRSMALRTQMALDRHLGGIALWRVGSDEAGALEQLPAAARKSPASSLTKAHLLRSVRDVRASGVVALTFDDGPDPQWTPQVLAILRSEHVPATFFVVGQSAEKHQSLVRDEVRDGNVVGNHTYSHKDLSHVGTFGSKAEILGGSAVIEGITGRVPYLFRSPYGAGDRSGVRVGGDQLANDLGEHSVTWNVDPLDWSKPIAKTIADRVAGQIQERSIVLLHDGGGDRSRTIAALPTIIHRLKAEHYLFTTVDGLDGSIASPYVARTSAISKVRGLTIVAAFRLWIAMRRSFLLVLSLIAALSLVRLLWSVPLALLQAARHRRWSRRLPVARTLPWPRVTIAVPAHDEAPVIAKTLRALQALRHPDGPSAMEIIVIDDGSSDGTADVARRAVEGPIPTRVISQPASKKAGALNRAFSEATGEIVVVIDADTVVDAGLVEAFLPHYDDPRVGAVAGNVKVGNQETIFGKIQALEYLVALNLDRRAQAAANVMAVVPGAAGSFRRSAVIEAGGYCTDTLVEDADLTVTLLGDGWRIPYEPNAIAYTEAPETLRDVVRQRRRWAFGTVEVLRKHRHRLLARRAGRVGLLGLPWMLLSQVVLPLLGPLCELFLIYLLLVHNITEAGGILLLAAAADVVLCVVVVVANRESPRLLLYVPLLRLVWRPLQLYAIAISTMRWLGGQGDVWRKVTRYDSVDVSLLHGSTTPRLT